MARSRRKPKLDASDESEVKEEEEKTQARRRRRSTPQRRRTTVNEEERISNGIRQLGRIFDRGVELPERDSSFGKVLQADADKMAVQLIQLASVFPPAKLLITVLGYALGPLDAFGRTFVLAWHRFRVRQERLQQEWEEQQQQEQHERAAIPFEQ